MIDYLHIIATARIARVSERGASAVEYGLLIAGVVLVGVGAMHSLGQVLNQTFGNSVSDVGCGC
jgi:pilus assembly protein Flp/PilA